MFDTEMIIAEKAYQTGMAEAAYMESMINAKLMINLANSELKVMTEATDPNGAVKDLLYLFNEAEKEAKGEKEGVVRKIGRTLSEFITKMINSIQKLFTGKNTERYEELMKSKETVELDFSMSDLMKDINKTASNFKSPKGIIIGLAAAIPIIGTIIAGTHSAFKKKEIVQKGKVAEGIKILEDSAKALEDSNKEGSIEQAAVQSNREEIKDKNGKPISEKEQKASFISNIFHEFATAIRKIAMKLGSKIGLTSGADDDTSSPEKAPDETNNNGNQKQASNSGNRNKNKKNKNNRTDNKNEHPASAVIAKDKEITDENLEANLNVGALTDKEMAKFGKLRTRFNNHGQEFVDKDPKGYDLLKSYARKLGGERYVKWFDLAKENMSADLIELLEQQDLCIEKVLDEMGLLEE